MNMTKAKLRELAHGWYVGIEPPPTSAAVDHFARRCRDDPLHAMEYSEALRIFIADAEAMSPTAHPYMPASSHLDSSEFRRRMKEVYPRTARMLAELADDKS